MTELMKKGELSLVALTFKCVSMKARSSDSIDISYIYHAKRCVTWGMLRVPGTTGVVRCVGNG
jgi:hypothetical protein